MTICIILGGEYDYFREDMFVTLEHCLGVPPAASLDADRCAPGQVVQRVVVTRGDDDGRPSQGGWTPGVPRADVSHAHGVLYVLTF